ncbi:rho guanine nucleotide exchange factor 2-like isoform X3 [Carcharodon carcharias]|uniref:rho guanine nucleotide exchange factor 2-like isoform X3 n=1 Tax=Carcharodon carcharias TaxID=13397 RepID=UPI001B7E6FEC|nr:rho guanine nucleotide exchange factor 2-like isoform X3 [Carcharodon carcharias]
MADRSVTRRNLTPRHSRRQDSQSSVKENKEREKLKEKEKEAKERETRISNGHHFNSITVSGNTLCYACNKSIITKEAFICPNCNVTIHKTCKDTLSSCTKVKQKQLKAAQVKNNSALQNVSMRHKVPLGRERPNSAIYPSDSFRQSPLFSQLGTRRGRSAFQSLSKSVSTNNIGNLNDDTPLGIRRILSQSTDSLNMRNRTLSIESLIDEGAEVIYQQLMGDLEVDERYFEADSWSLAVDTSFLQQHKKDVMKRQDVIYELIQTEVHHMRTLKIMSDIFRKGMLEELQMDRCIADTMFPALDDLIESHVQFLSRLLERRKESLVSGSDKNFVINRIGDILVSQFSGQCADLMKRAYAEFCSRHTKAVKQYKELFTRDKRFQQFVRRMTRSSVLRRHGIQECILLVTQRITKYPVLIDRILQNTKGNEEDRRDLSTSLSLVKELISSVDQEVHECEKRFRLQDIYNRMDTKAVAAMRSGRQFRREDLIRRKLVHDGFLLWKTAAGRFKDIQVLLLTDVLIFLQEKDQRYSFPVLENKPAVIPLHKLIVRDIANQEKGMFLISTVAQAPEMYEIHTASKDERNTWIKVIQQAVNVCPEMDDFSMEIETKEILKELSDEIQQRDRSITELLEQRASLFLQILQLKACEELAPEFSSRKLFRSEASECPRGEKLMNDAMKEVQTLSELMIDVCGTTGQPVSNSNVDQTPENPAPGGTENMGGPACGNTNDEQPNVNGTSEVCRTDLLTISGQDRNGNQLQMRSHNEEVLLRLSRLSALLHGLQALVVKQDSVLELQRQQLGEQKERLNRQNSRESPLVEQERLRSMEKQREELVGLRRQHGLLQEEFQRCRKACEEKAQELRSLEARLQESEQSRVELQREMEEWRQEAPVPALSEGQRRKKKSHSRQFSLPSAQFSGLNANALQRRRSADESCLWAALSCEGWPEPGPWPPWRGQPEGSSALPCLAGPETPAPTDPEEAEPEGGPRLRQAGPLEEEEESEGESPPPSTAQEPADLEQLQNIPESYGSGQPAPGEGNPVIDQLEEEDDDLYY